MKKTRRLRLLALALAFTMAVPSTAYAAPGGWNNQRQSSRYQNHWYQNSWFNSVKQTETTTETEMEAVESAETVVNPEMLRATTYEATTTETTTTSSLWGLTRETEQTKSTTTVKYFPVTMYDYNTTAINAATDAKDDDLTVREGLYFTGGSPEYEKTTEADLSAFVAGEYYIQNIRASENRTDGACWLQAHSNNKIYAVTKENANVWTLSIEDGQYYLSTEVNGAVKYMVVGTNGDNDGYTTTKTPVALSGFSGNSQGVQISQNNHYLCQWGYETAQDFGGYNVNNDSGNGMRFYPVDSDTPVVPGGVISYISSGYEEWNRWDKASGNNDNGDLIYTGLVADTFVNDQLVFNMPDGGIFNDDTTVKTVYEYVGLPFVLDSATGVYSFDSDKNGVYFADTDGDGSSDPQSGTAEQPYNLYFAKGVPQKMPSGLSVGDGSTNAWLPYNSQTNYNTSQVNYHFGMRADLPFSMTANGRVKSTDDESAPITFTFSGDDDVWVFVDGHLVIDLGGIHNRLDATIDFAANTITYSEENSQDDNNVTGSYNDPGFQTTQKLFTDADGKGIIDMSREVFAMDEDHEMSVFYLERGKGTSNCRIEFNLPMHDAVIVTKDATQSWSEQLEDAGDENEGITPLTSAEQAIVDNIQFGFTLCKKDATTGDFVPVTNTNYYLLGKGVSGTTVVSTDANGHFYLKNGQSAKFITDIPATGATYYVVEDVVPDGFVTPDFKYAGEAVGGFGYYDVDYDDDGTRHDEETETKVQKGSDIPELVIHTKAVENKSHIVTVYGSVEANDTVEFQCINFMNSEMPNPTATAPEDIIVLDYGLPVQIDPLANDVFRGENIEIVYVGGADVKVNEKKEGILLESVKITENGVDVAVPSKDTPNVLPDNNVTVDNTKFHSGSLVFNNVDYTVSSDGTVTRDTFTYTLDKQLTEVEVISYVVKVMGKTVNETTGSEQFNYDYEVGRIYIVPATTMYYEENFSGLVKFANSANASWDVSSKETDSSAVSEYQEPGVVGTVDDSTYGSDVAYLNDSGDSNGTSRFGDTTNGPIRFAYTFTGTGTSIFARTSAETGYMQIKLYKGTTSTGKDYMNITYRDTYYKDENTSAADNAGTLYNIPVYTQADLEYGTYTVVVTIAAKGTPTTGNSEGSGAEFYLDGIRIMEPLNESNDSVINAETGETITDKALGAYAADGEANMDVVTLRYKMITDAEEGLVPWNFAVLTDIDGEIVTAEDYVSIGPKEEVYLDEGQTVSFGVKYWHQSGYKLYMGMKAPMGSAEVKSGKNTRTLENATDCYYDITGDYTSVITKYEQARDEEGRFLFTDAAGNSVYEEFVDDGSTENVYKYVTDGRVVADDAELTPVYDTTQPYQVAVYTLQSLDGIVSLTNIKAVGNYEFELVEDIDIDINNGNGGEE